MSKPRPLRTLADVVLALRSGSSCAVLVEGEEQASDAAILKFVLLSSVGEEVTFHGRDGRERLLAELPDFVRQLPNDSVFAILDRDFLEDEVVEAAYQPGYGGHTFVWRRYAIENYLLEPAWVAEAVEESSALQPGPIPQSLSSADSVERFLLDWCRRLAPQVAGSWAISDVARESRTRQLAIDARPYFTEIFERDAEWVLDKLTRHYSGWAERHPKSCAPAALKTRFEDRLSVVSSRVQTLAAAHTTVNGKTLLNALFHELSSSITPSRKDYIRTKLVNMARKQVPDDVREIVVDRILPRWRRARGLA